MTNKWLNAGAVVACVIAGALIASKNVSGHAANQILNVSYDPTRELYLSRISACGTNFDIEERRFSGSS